VSDAEENERLWKNFSLANELSPAQRHRWRLVLRELATLPNGAVIVDLGCGSGVLLEQIGHARQDARLIGIDADPNALVLAAQRLPSAELQRRDLDSVDGVAFDGIADAVVCSEVLEHLTEPQNALRMARELLRPGGRLVVTVPSGPMNDFDRAIGHQKHYRPAELTDLLTSAGFRDVRTTAWGFPFHTLFRIALAAVPQTTEQFSDEKIGAVHRIIFRLLDALFYLNIRSRRLGRQLIATAVR